MPYQTTTIGNIIAKVNRNQICLPSIQRKYKWNENQIVKLFDSLYHNYPIGTFLIWNVVGEERINSFRFYKFLNNYHERDRIFNDLIPENIPDQNIDAVLDGQQRMTSIYLALQGTYTKRSSPSSPNFITRQLYFNILGYKSEESSLFKMMSEMESRNANSNHNNAWIKANEFVLQRWADWIADRGNNQNTFNHIISTFDFNFQITEVKNNGIELMRLSDHIANFVKRIHEEQVISYYTITQNVSLNTVAEIFIRINSGGTVLSVSDLLFSTVISSWEAGRELMDNLVNEIKRLGFEIDTDLIMRTCLYLTDSNILFKVENFDIHIVQRIQTQFVNEEANLDIYRAIVIAFKFLRNRLGIANKTITSKNALIPIIYHIYKGGILDEDDSIKEIQKYLYISILNKVFGSHGDTLLKELRNSVSDAYGNYILAGQSFNLNQLLTKVNEKREKYTLNSDDIIRYLNAKKGKAAWLVLSLIYPPLQHEISQFDQDHLHPKSKFVIGNIPNGQLEDCLAKMDTVPNLGFAGPMDNRQRKNSAFLNNYINNILPNDQIANYKSFNLIDEDMSLDIADFINFYERRKNKMFYILCDKLEIYLNNEPRIIEQRFDEIDLDEIEDDDFFNNNINEIIGIEIQDVAENDFINVSNIDTNNPPQPHDFYAVKVNGNILHLEGRSNSTTFFKAFLNFCIDNYSTRLSETQNLKDTFKETPGFPDFSYATINYNRVREHNSIYYHDYQDTLNKIKIIKKVSEDLGLNVELKFNP